MPGLWEGSEEAESAVQDHVVERAGEDAAAGDERIGLEQEDLDGRRGGSDHQVGGDEGPEGEGQEPFDEEDADRSLDIGHVGAPAQARRVVTN